MHTIQNVLVGVISAFIVCASAVFVALGDSSVI
jgi:hypothetical protein